MRAFIIGIAVAIAAQCGPAFAQPAFAQAASRPETVEPKGRIVKHRYVSTIDGAEIEYALYYPAAYDTSRPWPLIVCLHGSGAGDDWSAPTKPHAGIPVRSAKSNLDFLVVFPMMRGSWSIHTAAEMDILDTIEDVQKRTTVDADRIHLTGVSMGAFAAWSVATRYPDRFASLSIFAGGGPPELAGNLRHLSTRIYHATGDKRVPVAESRRLVKAMKDLDIPVRYIEIKGGAHDCWKTPLRSREYYDWLSRQERSLHPRRITYTTRSLRHYRAYWAQIDSVIDPERIAAIDVFAPNENEVYIHAENVGRLTLSPPAEIVSDRPRFVLNSEPVEALRTDAGWMLQVEDSSDVPLRKHPRLSGPIQDVLHDRFVIVLPDIQDPTAAAIWKEVARRAFRWRQDITFESFDFLSADQITPDIIAACHLICLGYPGNNSILARVSDRLPLAFRGKSLTVAGQPATVNVAAYVMIYPNPLNQDRYIVVCSGHPRVVGPLTELALRPPFLSATPLEDLIVAGADDIIDIAFEASDESNDSQWMAAEIPQRGAVFDRFWQLSDSVIEKLTSPPSQNATSQPAPGATTRSRGD